MKNLDSKRFALTIFGVFAICFCLVAYRDGKSVSDVSSALFVAYKTVPLVLLVVGIFVAYAWRWKVFRGWLVPFPDLNGTWQGSIQTTWKNPETGAIPAAIPVILTIKQSFVRISCVMRTAEMTSRSYLADFWLNGDEQVRMIGYSYHSKPLPSVVARSQPHDGTIVFQLIGEPVAKLKGTYLMIRQVGSSLVHGQENLLHMDLLPPGLVRKCGKRSSLSKQFCESASRNRRRPPLHLRICRAAALSTGRPISTPLPPANRAGAIAFASFAARI